MFAKTIICASFMTCLALTACKEKEDTAHIVVSANNASEEKTGGFFICSAKTHNNSNVTITQTGKQ